MTTIVAVKSAIEHVVAHRIVIHRAAIEDLEMATKVKTGVAMTASIPLTIAVEDMKNKGAGLKKTSQ
jgi:hypothetical protein